MSQVALKSLRKSYGNLEVVHGIDLEIESGEFIVLLGPSGCGKTTTLRMVAGLEDISAGEITIGERVVNDVAPKNRNLAMVFQNYALYPNMTVRQNMAFALRPQGLSKDQIKDRVAQVAQILGLQDLLDRKPAALSGGQRQRVAMGRAMVRTPDVFLFDEPLSNLDAKLRAQMRIEIKKLHQDLRTTSIYVTHDQVEAMTLADRIVVMRDGAIEQIGTPREVFLHPRTYFVASFIGSPAMNLVSMLVAERDGRAWFEAGDLRFPAPDDISERLEAGAKVWFGVRPNHIAIATADTAGETVQGRVTVTELLGVEALVEIEIGTEKLIALVSERDQPDVGEIVHVRFQAGAAHVFDAASGLRIEAI